MANLTILCRRPNLSESAQQKGSSEFDKCGEFDERGKFDDISSKAKARYRRSSEFEKCGEFGKMANLTIFRRRPKFGRMRSKFGKNGEFNDISPKPGI